MSGSKNRQLILKEIPKGKLGPEHFQLRETDVPQPGTGEVLASPRATICVMKTGSPNCSRPSAWKRTIN